MFSFSVFQLLLFSLTFMCSLFPCFNHFEKKLKMRAEHTRLTVKRPPPHTSKSKHLHSHANHPRKSWRSDVPIILPGWGHHSPGQYPQYTRADSGPEAAGSSIHKHYTSPINTPHGRVKSRRRRKSHETWPKAIIGLIGFVTVAQVFRDLYLLFDFIEK